MPSIDVIVGLPHRSATKLRRERVRTTDGLLRRAANREARAELSAVTGIPVDDLLAWCRIAELISIKGIGGEYARLLTDTGVGTLRALAKADPAGLVASMSTRNGSQRVVRRLPTVAMVADWVAAAAGQTSAID